MYKPVDAAMPGLLVGPRAIRRPTTDWARLGPTPPKKVHRTVNSCKTPRPLAARGRNMRHNCFIHVFGGILGRKLRLSVLRTRHGSLSRNRFTHNGAYVAFEQDHDQ